jgi:molybdopterin molybdotransferase
MAVQSMISVEEARERILSLVDRMGVEDRPLSQAGGQVLAEDVVASGDVPPLANTSMDGYAVRASDTTGASESSPVRLRVIGELAAGYIFEGSVERGSAVRIMTGAPIPSGADAVVPFEETDEAASAPIRESGSFRKGVAEVVVLKAAKPGANVRVAGEDVKTGARVLPAGTTLHAPQIGLVASLGQATVRVYRRPVVALL